MRAQNAQFIWACMYTVFYKCYLVVVVEPIAIYILLFTAAYQLAMLYVLLCGPVRSIFTPSLSTC